MAPTISITPSLLGLLEALARCTPGEEHIALEPRYLNAARELHIHVSTLLPRMKQHGGKLQCPHCDYYEGKRVPHEVSKAMVRRHFLYVEDGLITRAVSGEVDENTLSVSGEVDADDDGDNPRLECPACKGQFLLGADVELDFQ